MADDITFDQDFGAEPGRLAELSPLVRRIVAANGGPVTFTGTCTYLVGRGTVAVIDPGPDDPAHVAAILDAVRGESVSHILVTHTHRDHSPAAAALKAATGALLVGCAPHHAARSLAEGEANRLEASNDHAYAPDQVMRDGDAVSGPGWTLGAVETPGHTANHLAFALPQESALFSGDHVMAWSTTFIGPPDGSMTEYMASLDKVRCRDETIYWPGHGGPVREPRRFVRALLHHRRQREASILNRLEAGDRTIGEMVPAIYQGLAPALRGAAALNVFAHLEDLVRRGLATSEGAPTLEGRYARAR
ncbi:MBL fold metallo-hydrolase [Salinarimonas soli]|uniref:MBL fold metallo-hydrolase n=1 Tax=Salinarimonas soli TaxID=1638099 RepID=A0A5B2VAJ3_9HYPH|nr:MBL fold metallo-hydrolase [Salinarimonas soli]KAA2235470.1 MBL fold metallo-hydrolase [Salinarimonas soli]